MNKQEISIVVLLFLSLMAWIFWLGPKISPPVQPNAYGTNGVSQVARQLPPGGSGDDSAAVITSDATNAPAVAENTLTNAAARAEKKVRDTTDPVSDEEERLFYLGNDKVTFTITSKGGALRSAELSGYRELPDPESRDLILDFSKMPALSMKGLSGLGVNSDFDVVTGDGRSAVISAEVAGRYRFERHITLGDSYTLSVTDRVVNISSDAIEVPNWQISSGIMGFVEKNRSDSEHLSLDTFGVVSEGGDDEVKRWKSEISALFGGSGGGCSAVKVAPNAPMDPSRYVPMAPRWVAPKSKFFTLLLYPEVAVESMAIHGWRHSSVDGSLTLDGVAASLVYPPEVLLSGAEMERGYLFYAGPKQYRTLRDLGHGEEAIMEWGFFRVICRLLLPTLLFIYSGVQNWGVAIILLTFLVRGIFWPITHKGTESMKRMQELQPQIKELREKLKSEPQKLQQETMKLYRANKVNPMASCLPMLIQIPVFIALFTVLRSSVEMRHSGFLWIKDLSEPENLLFFGTGFKLNILPIVMSGTMAWQQYLTPSGDAQQKKMMMLMMPLMMLYMLYSMPSALMLYWSTSQIVSIVQLYWQRHRRSIEDAVKAGGVIDIEPKETRQMRRRKDK